MEAGVLSELRPAIELAFHLARSEARDGEHKPIPAALRPLLRFSRLPPRALDIVREVVDTDDEFRERVLAEVTESEVGELGWVWLSHPDGWRDLMLTAEEGAVDARRAEKAEGSVRATRKRLDRVDAERVSAEARVVELTTELESARSGAAASQAEFVDLREQVAKLIVERDAAQSRSGELDRRATRAESSLGEERQRRKTIESQLQERSANSPGPPTPDVATESHVAAMAVTDAQKKLEVVLSLLDRASHALPPPPDEEAKPPSFTRRSYRIGRGLVDDTKEGLRELMGVAGVRVLIDGYNVAKLGWPNLPLDLQRDRLLVGLESTLVLGPCVVDVVFDGADITSNERASKTPWVRVGWSPSGVTADDVIVDFVSEIPQETPVVVITDDRDIQRRSSRRGANIVSSRTLLSLLT